MWSFIIFLINSCYQRSAKVPSLMYNVESNCFISIFVYTSILFGEIALFRDFLRFFFFKTVIGQKSFMNLWKETEHILSDIYPDVANIGFDGRIYYLTKSKIYYVTCLGFSSLLQEYTCNILYPGEKTPDTVISYVFHINIYPLIYYSSYVNAFQHTQKFGALTMISESNVFFRQVCISGH